MQLNLASTGFESVALGTRGAHCHRLLFGFLLRKPGQPSSCAKGDQSVLCVVIRIILLLTNLYTAHHPSLGKKTEKPPP